MNEGIRANVVRVIGLNGEALGTLTTQDALRTARRLGTDLIEISPHASPPVCRLISVGKFRYQLRKKQQQDRPKSKHTLVKEVKLTPNISGGDYDTKLRRVLGFLGQGNQVRITVKFRGRELRRKDIGLGLLERVGKDLAKQEEVEFTKKEEEKCVSALASPNRKSKMPKVPK